MCAQCESLGVSCIVGMCKYICLCLHVFVCVCVCVFKFKLLLYPEVDFVCSIESSSYTHTCVCVCECVCVRVSVCVSLTLYEEYGRVSSTTRSLLPSDRPNRTTLFSWDSPGSHSPPPAHKHTSVPPPCLAQRAWKGSHFDHIVNPWQSKKFTENFQTCTHLLIGLATIGQPPPIQRPPPGPHPATYPW